MNNGFPIQKLNTISKIKKKMIIGGAIMNLYIILTRNIINIGGAEIYTLNKFLYLKERFDVVIFSCNCGKIYINELKNFKNYIFEELQIDPFF